jgi:predicted nucleotidyltransferase
LKACGLVVEYNPFHNGHLYHINCSREKTNADCMIAVISGNFLQRGEPAIIDKWHRTKAALQSGVDLVVELPYVFAVQHADLFAKGAVLTLQALGVNYLCFGSESGEISAFVQIYQHLNEKEAVFQARLKENLKKGLSFPEASKLAYEEIGITNDKVDLSQPNNILGLGYVKAIFQYHTGITPETIQRTKSNYHDEEIKYPIASATSIRKDILLNHAITERAKSAIPEATLTALETYYSKTNTYHQWEDYFPLLQHMVLTLPENLLKEIQGIEEGLENRLKKTAKIASSFQHWMDLLKTKRYTWTRLQRMFVHILTCTTKTNLQTIHTITSVPYVRVLGMNNIGKQYLQKIKKQISVPLVTKLQDLTHSFLTIEERAIESYYLAVPPANRDLVRRQDVQSPIIIT